MVDRLTWLFTAAQPLEDILDLSKASTLSPPAIAQLWTAYHQGKGLLSAAIPTATYEAMLGVAQRYPLFVLPLARDIVGDVPEGLAPGAQGAVEMHFLVRNLLGSGGAPRADRDDLLDRNGLSYPHRPTRSKAGPHPRRSSLPRSPNTSRARPTHNPISFSPTIPIWPNRTGLS